MIRIIMMLSNSSGRCFAFSCRNCSQNHHYAADLIRTLSARLFRGCGVIMVYIIMIMLRHGSYPWCAIWGLCWCILLGGVGWAGWVGLGWTGGVVGGRDGSGGMGWDEVPGGVQWAQGWAEGGEQLVAQMGRRGGAGCREEAVASLLRCRQKMPQKSTPLRT